jgi:hypothetical protein
MFRDVPGFWTLAIMAAFAIVAVLVTVWQLLTGVRF